MFRTSKKKLLQHLKIELALESNALVWLHSGIKGLGILEDGINTITEAFSEVLYDGILIIPTFSYSWNRMEQFDRLTTECPDMGGYASKAWKNSKFQRNFNPIFSVAIMDNTADKSVAEALVNESTKTTCFGDGSSFDLMEKISASRPGHIILLGGAHDDVVFRSTFLHLVEERVGVPYRYVKYFFNPSDHHEKVGQYVRYFSEEEYKIQTFKNPPDYYRFPIKESYNQLGNDLTNEGMIKRISFGYSETRMVEIYAFCEWLENKLLFNPEFLMN